MRQREPMIIAYDISLTKSRTRVFKTLTRWKLDGQKSVVECLLATWERDELILQIAEELDPLTDRLLVGMLDTRRQCLGLGKGQRTANGLLKVG